MNSKLYKILTVVALLMLPVIAWGAPSAEQVMAKASSALLKGGGVTATYTYKQGGQSSSGTLKVKGKKFAILTKGNSLWYDGKTMWSYDAYENEVTLTNPTAGELASMNPYALVSSYKKDYTVRLVTGKIKGTYNVQLTPKSKNNPVKSATLCLRASNYMPVRLDVTSRDGSKNTIIVSDIRTGQSLPDATFRYPAKSHPKARTVDLR